MKIEQLMGSEMNKAYFFTNHTRHIIAIKCMDGTSHALEDRGEGWKMSKINELGVGGELFACSPDGHDLTKDDIKELMIKIEDTQDTTIEEFTFGKLTYV